MRARFLFLPVLVLILSGYKNSTCAQSYGLGFESFEVVQDKRTGLDLSPDQTLCFNSDFEISFEMSFLADRKNYFGYIVRLIENDTRNIDVLYDNSDAVTQHFKVVIGDRFSTIAFNIPEADLYSKWNKIRLLFNKKQKTIILISGSKSYRYPFKSGEKSCYKMLFGATRYKNFTTTDVPPMKLRNVVISEDGTRKYYWPLDEMSGNKAPEMLAGRDAFTNNPLWIKKMHYDWQPLKTFVLQGPARVTCDQAGGNVHIVSRDSLISYRIATSQMTFTPHAPQSIFMDDQVLYEKSLDKVFNIHINERKVTAFDLKTRTWNRNEPDSTLKTHFLHANKFYSKPDSAIYLLGGYGHLEYKSNVQKYSLGSGTWTDLPKKDTVFTPRYLAALGAAKGGAYLIGGYGSTTGKQILNPRNWYDLLFFNVKNQTFKRIYQLETPSEDFVFANSMVIRENEGSFYALIHPKDKFNTALQLIRGSLTTPGYVTVGSQIPYQFLDTGSFADLYYDQHSHRFVAVTLNKLDKNQTRVAIYSLYSPPLSSSQVNVQEQAGTGKQLWIGIALLVLAGGFILYLRKKTPAKAELPTEPGEVIPAPEMDEAAVSNRQPVKIKPIPQLNSILLFGNLQIFDDQGVEITKSFTPLLKELFLVLLLYSTRREGISSEKLKELLWFDKTADSARNNRSVNIAKLKTVLDKLQHCTISKETGYWRLNVDHEHILIDYALYLDLVSGKRTLTKQEVSELANITKRGSFLANQEYEWLDSFKSEVSNEIVDAYLRYATSVDISDDPEFLIRLANYIFYFDPVNEEAMTLKCKALAHLGKHSMAKATLENFAREYSRIYGEEFNKDMPEVLHS
ncbi:galactose oxidase [Dyadobacter luticola]|uniref:Galactose oxidase n=1 Tax=Dyadobacter luticola TaxID=1979387 RepID=A0A5R9L0X5_9BACT|nr:galactose oxidase [Dyadobacter luticola]TLV02173.1 galactose oxidase [Dyadobacter luticola]